MVRHTDLPDAPPAPVDPRLSENRRPPPPDLAARWLAWAAGFIALVGLAGWVLRITAPTLAVFGVQPMVPMTAATIALCSLAIMIGTAGTGSTGERGSSVVLKSLAGIALLISLSSVVHDAIGIARGTAGFDATLIDEVAPGSSGWLAPNTAISLVLIGMALLLEPRTPSGATGRRRIIAIAGTTALLITVLTLVGYIYGVDPLRGLPGHLSMAVNTAIAIAALAIAVLLRSTGGGLGDLVQGRDAGAVLARLALPATIILPLALGALKVVSDRAGWFGPTMGTALRTLAEMVVFAGLTLVAVRRLRRIDREREQLIDDERHAREVAQEAQASLEEHAEALEEQAQELEMTVDELRSANETVEAQRTIAEEARAAESRAKALLDTVIDQLPVGVVLARMPSGEVVRRNRMGEEIAAALDRGREGLRGDTLVWYRPNGEPYAPSDHPLNRTVRTGEVIEQEEMTARLGDGTSVHVAVSATPVYERGTASMAVAVFADVSPRRAAETALAERDALLASFFRAPDVMLSVVEADVSPEALAKAEVDYRFLLMNGQAASVFGKTERDVMGLTARGLGIPPEQRRSFVQSLGEARRTAKPTIVERPGVFGKGPARLQWVSIVISPLNDQPDRIPRFCLIATDMSHRRHLEEELRQAQKLEAVGRLAGGIAHDFNNLLTAITGFTGFALADVPEESSVREDLEQALLAAERAAVLTHQLLAFSRQQVLQPQVLDMNDVVANIEPMLRRVIGEDIAIHQSLGAAAAVRADRGQLEQVLVNLVVNARDAMPEGGVLTIETADVELDTAQSAAQGGSPGPHVMLAVTDTGVGMSSATRDRIFEPFFTTKQPGQGTGLGLATVFGIVRQSGGSIWVYSEPEQGTTFKIYLPRYDGPSETSRAQTPVSVPAVSGRVLVVEDDAAVRSIAARVLRRGGFDVVEATNGREGLAKYHSLGGRVDLILTDLVLPEMGGRAMIQALAADGAHVPVVYMSGYTAEAMSAQSVLESGDLFVEKPFTPDALLQRVRDALEGAAREPRRAG